MKYFRNIFSWSGRQSAYFNISLVFFNFNPNLIPTMEPLAIPPLAAGLPAPAMRTFFPGDIPSVPIEVMDYSSQTLIKLIVKWSRVMSIDSDDFLDRCRLVVYVDRKFHAVLAFPDGLALVRERAQMRVYMLPMIRLCDIIPPFTNVEVFILDCLNSVRSTIGLSSPELESYIKMFSRVECDYGDILDIANIWAPVDMSAPSLHSVSGFMNNVPVDNRHYFVKFPVAPIPTDSAFYERPDLNQGVELLLLPMIEKLELAWKATTKTLATSDEISIAIRIKLISSLLMHINIWLMVARTMASPAQ